MATGVDAWSPSPAKLALFPSNKGMAFPREVEWAEVGVGRVRSESGGRMWGAGGDGERSALLCDHPPRPTPTLRTQGLDSAPSVYSPCQAQLWPHLHTHVSGHSGTCVSPRPPEGHCVGQTWPVGPDESPSL